MTFRSIISALALGGVLASSVALAQARVEVVPRDAVELIPLNPARGDASPKAGVLWGDIRKDVSSGALIKFADGFASPPHIHNITYRAVVLEGTVHNDDPDAENFWMGPGSFWTQPAGEVHITSVGPGGGTAFLEILSGPYLVRPSAEAFDNGERPINVEERNVIWLDSSDVKWVEQTEDVAGPEMAFLWGVPEATRLNGTFVKLPAGYEAALTTSGGEFRGVVVKGRVTHSYEGADASALSPGSYVGSMGEITHNYTCSGDSECVFYVRSRGTYQVSAVE